MIYRKTVSKLPDLSLRDKEAPVRRYSSKIPDGTMTSPEDYGNIVIHKSNIIVSCIHVYTIHYFKSRPYMYIYNNS